MPFLLLDLFCRPGRVAVALLATLPACGDCEDEIEAARTFLDANRACQTDDDCVAVNTGCHTFANGVCGQAPLQRDAAESEAWAALQDDLLNCQSDCARCMAALAPVCREGVCGGPP